MAGGESGGQRLIFERDENSDVRLAVQDGCDATDGLTQLRQEEIQPEVVRSAGVGDQVFSDVLKDFFNGRPKPSSHLALAEIHNGRMSVA